MQEDETEQDALWRVSGELQYNTCLLYTSPSPRD